MTVSMQTCLDLSSAVYGGSLESKIPSLDGWEQIDFNNDGMPDYDKHPYSGFVGAAYGHRIGTDENGNAIYDNIVIAYRGTERYGLGDHEDPNNPNVKEIIPDANDFANDVQIVAGFLPGQYDDAWTFYQSIKAQYGNNITITGHSLGGGLAELVAAKALNEYGISNQTYTFNAPGTKALLGQIGCNTTLDYSFINNYVVMNDWCGMHGAHVGDLYTIPPIPIEKDTNPIAQFFNTMTNTHEGILDYVESANGPIESKPIGFNQSEGESLWYYDVNNKYRTVDDLVSYLNTWYPTLPTETVSLFTSIIDNIILEVSETALKNAVNIINSTIGTPLNILHYTTSTGDIIIDSAHNDILQGTDKNDTIYGNEGNDVIKGLAGNDILYGGSGNDTYKFNNYRIDANNQISNVVFSATIADSDGQGQIILDQNTLVGGNYFDVNEFVDNKYNVYNWAGNGSNLFINDNITVTNFHNGDLGINLLGGSSGGDTTGGGTSGETNYWTGDVGGPTADTRVGTSGTDYLEGGYLDDVLYGGAGNDYLFGGINMQNMNDGNDKLYGGSGNDIIMGGKGNDILYGENGNDAIYGGEGNNVIYGGAGNDRLAGGNGNDYIDGGDGNDSLEVTAGTGTLMGGSGDDTYLFMNMFQHYGAYTINDTSGNDIIRFIYEGSSLTDFQFNLSDSDLIINNLITIKDWTGQGKIENFEVMLNDGTIVPYTYQDIETLIPPQTEINGTQGNDNLTGTNQNDTIYGYEGNDYINGGDGDDIIYGGDGNDTLIAGLGNNQLYGGAGDDVLYNSTGANILAGGTGNDTYYIDSTQDTLIEYKNEGIDKVYSKINHTLQANFENLELMGSAILGTGNELNNIITGNNQDNILDGKAGLDTLIGDLGNDTYYVDDSNDVIVENLNKGRDKVYSSVSYALVDNIEDFELTGTNDINGTGNQLNNVISGNTGNNILNGGSGIDTLIGRAGNDTYIVDDLSDVIVENLNEGIDTVKTDISYALGINFENLVLTGSDNIDAIGNSLDNVLTGNSGNNILNGEAGNDTYFAGTGNDIITDISGNDSYIYNSGDGQDVITDIEGADIIKFGENIIQNDIVFIKDKNDLIMAFKGTSEKIIDASDRITVKDWYLGNRIESIAFNDNTTLNTNDVEKNAKTLITGTDTDDNLKERDTNSILDTGSGNDMIQDYFGDDIIYAGAGNDKIFDYDGNDTYVFYKGDGQDVLYDLSNNTGDKISFAEGISKEDISFFMKGNTLTLSYSSEDSITIYNQGNQNHGIEIFELNDGSYLNDTDINNVIQNMTTYEKDHKGFHISNVNDVKNNQELMALISNSWHA